MASPAFDSAAHSPNGSARFHRTEAIHHIRLDFDYGRNYPLVALLELLLFRQMAQRSSWHPYPTLDKNCLHVCAGTDSEALDSCVLLQFREASCD